MYDPRLKLSTMLEAKMQNPVTILESRWFANMLYVLNSADFYSGLPTWISAYMCHTVFHFPTTAWKM